MHPKYLDAKGIVALWRETLLAKSVLEGKTRGYRYHPQLERFKRSANALYAINWYLSFVFAEAEERGYDFDGNKIDNSFRHIKIPLTQGQLDYEIEHLLKKLESRDIERFNKLKKLRRFEVNPIFELIPGTVENWEIRR